MPGPQKGRLSPRCGVPHRSRPLSRLRYISNAFTMVSSIFCAGVPAGKNLSIRFRGILNCYTWFGFSSCMMERITSGFSLPFSEKSRILMAWAWEGVQSSTDMVSSKALCSDSVR